MAAKRVSCPKMTELRCPNNWKRLALWRSFAGAQAHDRLPSQAQNKRKVRPMHALLALCSLVAGGCEGASSTPTAQQSSTAAASTVPGEVAGSAAASATEQAPSSPAAGEVFLLGKLYTGMNPHVIDETLAPKVEAFRQCYVNSALKVDPTAGGTVRLKWQVDAETGAVSGVNAESVPSLAVASGKSLDKAATCLAQELKKTLFPKGNGMSVLLLVGLAPQSMNWPAKSVTEEQAPHVAYGASDWKIGEVFVQTIVMEQATMNDAGHSPKISRDVIRYEISRTAGNTPVGVHVRPLVHDGVAVHFKKDFELIVKDGDKKLTSPLPSQPVPQWLEAIAEIPQTSQPMPVLAMVKVLERASAADPKATMTGSAEVGLIPTGAEFVRTKIVGSTPGSTQTTETIFTRLLKNGRTVRLSFGSRGGRKSRMTSTWWYFGVPKWKM